MAMLGNNAQASTQTVSATLQYIKAGKLRPFASFGGKRSKALPDVPTLKELGYDLEYYLWVGLFAPKATPADIDIDAEHRHRQGREAATVHDRHHQYRPRTRLSQRGGFRQVLGRGRQARRRRGEVHRPRAGLNADDHAAQKFEGEMDRRSFVIGSSAAAAGRPHGPHRRRRPIRRTPSPSSIRSRPAAQPTWSAGRSRRCWSRWSSSRA